MIDDDILVRSEKAAAGKKHRRIRAALLAAAAIAVLLVLTVGASAIFGWNETLLSYLHITEDRASQLYKAAAVIEKAQTRENITVTVKQAFGDAHTAYIVAEAQIPPDIPLDGDFQTILLRIKADGGYNYECVKKDEETRTLTYLIRLMTEDTVTGKKIGLIFRGYENALHETLVSASWEFSFRLDFRDFSRKSTVNGKCGAYTVRSVTVTPVSVIIDIDGLPPENRLVEDFGVIMRDGSSPDLAKYQHVGTSAVSAAEKTTSVYGVFRSVIEPQDVEAVSVNGTVFMLN